MFAGKNAGLRTLARQQWEANQKAQRAEQARQNAQAQAAVVKATVPA